MPNEMPPLQRLINNASFFLLGVTLFGSLLDSASNAIDIISPAVTWFGIAAVVVAWLGLYIALRLRAVRWRTPDSTAVRPVSIPTGAKWATLGVICLLVLPRFVDGNREPVDRAALLPPPRIVTSDRTTVFVFIPGDDDKVPIPEQRRAARRDNAVTKPSTTPTETSVIPATRNPLSAGIDAVFLSNPLPSGGFLNERFFARAIDGRIFRSKDFAGKVVVVNMWATWCSPCLTELPRLARFAEERTDSVVLLAVAERESPTHVRAYTKNTRLSIPLIPDEEGRFSAWFPGEGVIPRTYVVGPDGQVFLAKKGPVDLTELAEAVTTALTVRPAA